MARRNESELRRRLGSRLEFGTAGLRGPMGAGYAFTFARTAYWHAHAHWHARVHWHARAHWHTRMH